MPVLPSKTPAQCLALVVLLSVVSLRAALGAGPPINLNIRRAATAPPVTPGPSPSSASQSSSAGNSAKRKVGIATGQWGGVALDLSGEFSCHISSPHNGDLERDGRTPLFRVGSNSDSNNGRIPSIHIGGGYDFSKVWYGATRMFGSLSWHGQKVRDCCGITPSHTNNIASNKSSSAIQRMRDNLSRCTMSVRAEKDIRQPNDGAAQLCLKKRLDSRNEPYVSIPPSLTLRVETNAAGESATVALRTPIHRRVDIVSKSTVFLYLDGDGSKSKEGQEIFASRLPPRTFSREDWETGSWLPDILLSPTGWLAARSEIGLPPHSSTNIKMGIRLSVNRQVPWSLWGAPDDNDEEEHNTWIRLQFCGANSSGDAYYSASIDAAIERIVDSIRLTLAQEQIVRPSW